MPINEILPFAVDVNSNVATQAEYAASSTTKKGHLQGVAPSKLFNKAWRQALFVCSALAQFVAEQSGQDVLDDGNMPNLKNKLMAAIRSYAAAPAGSLGFFAGTAAPAGWLKANGAAISIGTYQALATYIYVGDADNATADYGYKCTDPINPNGTRNTNGGYIVLPDYRDEFIRGWADGKNGNGRKVHALELDAIKAHNHTASTDAQGFHAHTGSTTNNGDHQHWSGWGEASVGPYGDDGARNHQGSKDTDWDNNMYLTSSAGGHTHGLYVDGNGAHSHNVTVNSTGGTETHPRNRAALACIKY